MNLNTILKGNTESLEDFEARTSWITHKYDHFVLVWKNKTDRINPNCSDCKKWSHEKAIGYIGNLESEDIRDPETEKWLNQKNKDCI